MHPSQEELRLYIENICIDSERQKIQKHLSECRECSDFCEQYSSLIKGIDHDGIDSKLSKNSMQLADKLYIDAVRSSPIKMNYMKSDMSQTEYALAADGQPEPEKHVHSLATLYSEDPDIVLKIMRDPQKNVNYLQLLCEDQDLISGAMVQIPERDQNVITDEQGYAELEDIDSDDINNINWQIKLPDAVFNLNPLTYDPDKVLYSQDTILTTGKKDRIKVRFEGKTEGKQISISILELNGRTDIENIKVVVSQQDITSLSQSQIQKEISFKILDSDHNIIIRLYS